eukprot:5364996-Pleurochrysis_carterae.AAC.1
MKDRYRPHQCPDLQHERTREVQEVDKVRNAAVQRHRVRQEGELRQTREGDTGRKGKEAENGKVDEKGVNEDVQGIGRTRGGSGEDERSGRGQGGRHSEDSRRRHCGQ